MTEEKVVMTSEFFAVREKLMQCCGKGDIKLIFRNGTLEFSGKGDLTYLGNDTWQFEYIVFVVKFHTLNVQEISKDSSYTVVTLQV